MSFTFQDVADRARVPLNDVDKDRYPDSELLTYAQNAYLLLRHHRPDIFLSSWATVSLSTLTLGTNFPLVSDDYLPAIADYVTARAEFKDDESVIAERAQAFYALWQAGVAGNG